MMSCQANVTTVANEDRLFGRGLLMFAHPHIIHSNAPSGLLYTFEGGVVGCLT
jgi:hypothetical protein